MTHIFKIPMQNSDMIINNIDFNNNTIQYHIRDKQTGNRLEPDRQSDFEISDNKIRFDNIRFIDYNVANQISQLLNSE